MIRWLAAISLVALLLTACMPTATPCPTCPPQATDTVTPAATATSTPETKPARGIIGNCHGVSNLTNGRVTWFYVSGAPAFWSTVEPAPGVFDFTALDEYVERVASAGKSIWVQVESSDPGNPVIPEWAIEAGVEQLPNCPASVPDCGRYDGSKAAQWGSVYHSLWEPVVAALADHYDANPTVEAVLIMAGGNYGEMSQTVARCHGEDGADVHNPDGAYIQSMAAATGEHPDILAAPYTDADGNYYVAKFDYYYVANTKRMIDMYLRYFHHTPVVIQVGSGVSCQMYQARLVAEYAVNTYPGRVILKQNGWGNTTNHPDYPYAYDALFNAFRGRARMIYEVGHPGLWCDMPGPAGFGCSLMPPANAADHNYKVMRNAIDVAGVSGVCFQSLFFQRPDVFEITDADFFKFENELRGNLPQ